MKKIIFVVATIGILILLCLPTIKVYYSMGRVVGVRLSPFSELSKCPQNAICDTGEIQISGYEYLKDFQKYQSNN